MADPTADALTPMADLAGRWGITANTVSRRLAFLGIKPIRQGNYRFLTPEQLATAEQLHQHILSGKPMESFPRPELEGESRLVARLVAQVSRGMAPSTSPATSRPRSSTSGASRARRRRMRSWLSEPS